VIGDLLLLFGLPAIPTSIVWCIQKFSGRLGPAGTYFRRRIYGIVVLFVLILIAISVIFALAALDSNSPDTRLYTSLMGRSMAKFLIIELPLIYWFGLKTEDGFLRAVFISYSSLTPQAKERLITGNLSTSNESSK